MTRLIDADKFRKQFSGEEHYWALKIMGMIDNAPTVEVPEDGVNCVLTMFGKCSYNETGCSDCEIKDKIRKALNARSKGKWIDLGYEMEEYNAWGECSVCGEGVFQSKFCPNCGAYMEADDGENE